MEIKADPIKRPFKLSQVAKYFDEGHENLLRQLAKLAAEGKIFAHDLRKIGETDDYELSAYAVTVLFSEHGATGGRMMKLAAFFNEPGDGGQERCFLVDTYIGLKTIKFRLKNLSLASKIKKGKRRRKISDDLILDELIRTTLSYERLES